ncbi:hypothetical protein SLA2020_356160 [Shorea laevis]
MAASTPTTSLMLDSALTNEIFSILENKFLFHDMDKSAAGKVRILSIDGAGSTDGILAAKALVHLEAFLRKKSGCQNASIAEYFDVVAGSGAGGVLAALLFTRGKDGGPIFSAGEALDFIIKQRRRIFRSSPQGIIRRIFRPSKAEKVFRKIFGESTLKDTLKPVLIPCYDLSSHAAFVFSRADALEIDSYDFKMKDVCAATTADPAAVGAVEMRSVDGRSRITAVEGGIAMNNPTAAAVTHVLNNKQEFPFCNGVGDLLVVSLGNGDCGLSSPDPTFLKIAGDRASDTVDEAVSMAFGEHRMSNYARIQGNGLIKFSKESDAVRLAEEMLGQKNVESVLFEGKKMGGVTNLEKLEAFGGEIIKEQERRKISILPTVVLRHHASASPRTSSATTNSTFSSN